MEHLRVYQSPYPKIRLGNNNDGGYIICDLSANYDVCLSGGIGNVDSGLVWAEGSRQRGRFLT